MTTIMQFNPTKVAVRALPSGLRQQEAVVTVIGYFYAVDFGPGAGPPPGLRQHHRVGKDKRCTCELGAGCPAVSAVADYLKAGGERTPEPRAGYYPVAPQVCPICSAQAYYQPDLNSKKRGAGWACARGGEAHYWMAQINALQKHLSGNPWIFPPVYALDGRELYPGLRREDVVVGDQPWPEGYNPNL